MVKPTRCVSVSNLFYWSNTLHVLDGLSAHHQELKTVHTATGICQADTADCLLASGRQYLFDMKTGYITHIQELHVFVIG